MGQTELPLYGDLRSLLLVRKRFEKKLHAPSEFIGDSSATVKSVLAK